jgi:hypothetical protein
MAEPKPGDRLPLTIYLTADVAQRLKLTAEAQKRTPADLAADLLERNLPRSSSAAVKKGIIPYG